VADPGSGKVAVVRSLLANNKDSVTRKVVVSIATGATRVIAVQVSVLPGDSIDALNLITPTAHNQDWSTITGKPTTISGYGLTDAASTGANTFTGAQILGTDPGGTSILRVGGSAKIKNSLVVNDDLYIGNSSSSSGVAFRFDGFSDRLSVIATPSTTAGSSMSFRTGVAGGSETDRVIINDNGSVIIATDPGGSEMLRVGGSLRIAGALRLQDATESQISLIKTGTSANTSYFFTNGTNIGLFDSTNSRFSWSYVIADGSFVVGVDPGGSGLLRVGGSVNIASGQGYKVAGTKVVGGQASAIADVSTADATDLSSAIALANANKAKINSILSMVRTHGLIAT
jgi:hypothetical protein